MNDEITLKEKERAILKHLGLFWCVWDNNAEAAVPCIVWLESGEKYQGFLSRQGGADYWLTASGNKFRCKPGDRYLALKTLEVLP